VVASAPVTSPGIDCIIALSYFGLQAATMGIGTTWCGLVKTALAGIAPEQLRDLEIPEDHELGYVVRPSPSPLPPDGTTPIRPG